jgi:hypothetical protein
MGVLLGPAKTRSPASVPLDPSSVDGNSVQFLPCRSVTAWNLQFAAPFIALVLCLWVSLQFVPTVTYEMQSVVAIVTIYFGVILVQCMPLLNVWRSRHYVLRIISNCLLNVYQPCVPTILWWLSFHSTDIFLQQWFLLLHCFCHDNSKFLMIHILLHGFVHSSQLLIHFSDN